MCTADDEEIGALVPEYAAAAVAGVFAAQVMELPAYTQRALGLPVRQDIFVETGAILRAPERFRSLVGWLGHACTAAFIAMGYAGFFAAVSAQPPNLWWGLLAGTIHFAAGAMVIAAYPLVHPDVPKRLPSPGFSYRRWGRRDVITFLLGHLLYGALVAALYRALTANGAAAPV